MWCFNFANMAWTCSNSLLCLSVSVNTINFPKWFLSAIFFLLLAACLMQGWFYEIPRPSQGGVLPCPHGTGRLSVHPIVLVSMNNRKGLCAHSLKLTPCNRHSGSDNVGSLCLQRFLWEGTSFTFFASLPSACVPALLNLSSWRKGKDEVVFFRGVLSWQTSLTQCEVRTALLERKLFFFSLLAYIIVAPVQTFVRGSVGIFV